MTSLFISHASPDRPFVLRLAHSLEQFGHAVWIDAREIAVGASIPGAVAAAVDRADYLIVILSEHSAASSWCDHEWNAKYWDEVVSRRAMVLPALLDDCAIPLFLRSKRHADFRADYAIGLAQLAIALAEKTTSQGTCNGIDLCNSDAEAIEQDQRHPSHIDSRSPVCYTPNTMSLADHLTEITVELEIPYLGKIAGVWTPDEHEQDACSGYLRHPICNHPRNRATTHDDVNPMNKYHQRRTLGAKTTVLRCGGP